MTTLYTISMEFASFGNWERLRRTTAKKRPLRSNSRMGSCYVPLQESHLLSRYLGLQKAKPNWRSLGQSMGQDQTSCRIGRTGSCGRLAQTSSNPRNSKRICICRRRSMAERIRRCLSIHRNPRPTKGNRSNQDRHGKGRTHGPFGLRWRRLRKTEVALRAAFKAVMDGKQVAVFGPDDDLVPTAPQRIPRKNGGLPD